MISLSIRMDRIVNGPAANHYRIVCNDSDDSGFDRFPAKTLAKTERRQMKTYNLLANHDFNLNRSMMPIINDALTFGQTCMSDSINSHDRMSPSHRVLFLSR